MIKQIIVLCCFLSFTASSFGQDRKLQRCYEYLQTKDFLKAEEIIAEVTAKTGVDPKVFYVKSVLFGSKDYSNYNVDSCFIYYTKSTALLSALDSKDLEEICSDFKLCLYDSRRVKDSIAAVAYESYKALNSIERMEQFKILYSGTSSIQAARIFIEELNYQSALSDNTVASYTAFLQIYPNSTRKETIELKIHELEFQRVSSLNDKVEYENYLQAYPNSKFNNDVLKKIELLDFEKLKQSNNLTEYETFLSSYPNSSYKQEVLDLFEQPYFEFLKEGRDLNLLHNFKLRYPESKKKEIVNDLICEIAFEEVQKTNTREAYKKFIIAFPKSKFESVAQQMIAELFPHVPKLLSNGKYKYIDKFNGNILIQTEFEEASLFENDQAIVKQNGYRGVIDEFGKVIVPCNFDEIDRLENKNFYLVKLNEKYGLYNNEGQKLLNPEFSYAYINTEELLGFNHYNSDWDYFSKPEYVFKIINKGITKYTSPYDELPYFNEGFAVVSKGNDYEKTALGMYSIIDTSFREIIPFKYNYIEQLYEDHKLFLFNVNGAVNYYPENGMYPMNGKWGIVNHQGKVLIPPVFDELRSITLEGSDGPEIYFIANRGKSLNMDYNMTSEPGNYGLIDKSGNEIIPFEFQEMYQGGKNQLIVNKGGEIAFDWSSEYVSGGKWGVIDLTNRTKVPIIYDQIKVLGRNYVVLKDSKTKDGKNTGKFGVIDENNKLLVPFSYDYIEPYGSDSLIIVANGCKWSEGRVEYVYGGKWGAVNQNGKLVFALNFDEIYTLDSNFVLVKTGTEYDTEYPGEIKKEGKVGLADYNAKLMLPIKYDDIRVGTRFIYATVSKKTQLFLKNGTAFSNTLYDELYELNDGYIAYRIGEKNGILNPDGSVLFPAMFWSTKTEYYYSFDIQMNGDLFEINEGGTYFFANRKGEIFKE
jgi:outer membrane protein assembly factor BamD (BamD/ComL family)